MKKLFLVIFVMLSYHSQSQESLYSIGIQGGQVIPGQDFSNFADKGFAGELNLRRSVGKKLSILLSTNFEKMNAPDSDSDWRKFSANIGPSYQILNKKIKASLFGQIGYASQRVPEINSYYPNTKVLVKSMKDSKLNSLQGVIGVKFGYSINSRVSLFVKPQYNTNFNKVSYQSRDVSPAIDDRGQLDIEAANNINFQNRTVNPSTGSINVGIDINFANDWNSTRSNKTSKTS